MQQMQQQQRPLTRYLPVRADGFDLRQHIETAGHQVELCPHVALTSTSARGYLHKMGSRFRTWNKRWFVFDRVQRTFLYFADKTETRKRSGAYFQVRSHFNRSHFSNYTTQQFVFCRFRPLKKFTWTTYSRCVRPTQSWPSASRRVNAHITWWRLVRKRCVFGWMSFSQVPRATSSSTLEHCTIKFWSTTLFTIIL